MKRITIKYWQELPLLVDSLKRENSQLVFEWNQLFNPSRNYVTSINFQDITIRFEGDYWRIATRLYQSFCQEYGLRLNIDNYIWLSEHTNIIKNSLVGDDVFNQYVRDNGGYLEAEEFVENNKLVNWHGEDFELYYNHRDMEMVHRLGMEIMPNKYQFRSKNGYYLPIDIHVRYNEIITKWLRREGSNPRKYQIIHSPTLTIVGVDKGSVFELAKYLYLNEGLYELIIQWVDEPDKTEYKIKVNNNTIYVKDLWKEENEEYVQISRKLSVLSEYELDSFKALDIMYNSHFSKEYGIELSSELYNRLNVPEDRLLRGLTFISGNTYGDSELALGSPVPMSVNAEGLRIKTPYNYIKSGGYRDVLLPLNRDESYNKYIQEFNNLDTDIRVVLGKSSIPKKEEKVELDEVIVYEEEKIPLSNYPRVEFDVEDLGLDFTDVEVESERLTKTVKDFKYIPYILEVTESNGRLHVTYLDGEELTIDKDDAFLRTRVVFRDRIGLTIRGEVVQLTELLLSLGTDYLESYTQEMLDDNKTQELIDEWLRALVSKDTTKLYNLVTGYSIGVAREEETIEEDDDFDIFEDIGLI